MAVARFSIRAMVFATFLVAADFAAMRLVGRYAPVGLLVGLFLVVPTSNIFAIALYRASKRETPGRPFLVGFGLAGTLASLAWFNGLLMADERDLVEVAQWYQKVLVLHGSTHLVDPRIRNVFYAASTLILLVGVGILPQVLVALWGGRIARRYAGASGPGGSEAAALR